MPEGSSFLATGSAIAILPPFPSPSPGRARASKSHGAERYLKLAEAWVKSKTPLQFPLDKWNSAVTAPLGTVIIR